jgi:hypothetical protein
VASWSRPPSITDSAQVHLTRERVGEPISATVMTDPQVALDPIVIEQLPPPTECREEQFKTDERGQLYIEHSTPAVRDHLYEDRRNWHVDVLTRGPIYNMDCHKLIREQTHFEIYFDKTRTYYRDQFATCSGWTETDGTAKIYLDVFYTMPKQVCTSVPWPKNDTALLVSPTQHGAP